jgi:hypothetical protein
MSAAKDEGEGNDLGREGNGPWPPLATGWIRSPGPFILFPIFFHFFFSVFFCENFQKHQKDLKQF